jgi:hypothetical protein
MSYTLFYSSCYVATEDAIAPLRTALHRRVMEYCALFAACMRWAQLYPRSDKLPSAPLTQYPRDAVV